jgi:tripartite-type tricarboxylate transporter receptor subunit TctC
MVLTKRTLLAAALTAVTTAVSTRTMAQTWPSKPIRLIVPLAPGATADIITRIYADELGKALGQTIVVDNKTGAGGTIATAEAARAAPDGYTMLLISQGTVVFNMGLYPKPGYDPVKDFDSVAVAGSVSNILVVHPDNPAKTVADVIAQAKAKPGEMTYSSGGTGTSHHMSALLFERDVGVKMQHVPYRTTPAGIMGVVNGEVAMGFYNTPTVIGQIKGGKLKAIAITSEQRSQLLPEIPTMVEQGVKGYVFNTWMGFAVPKGAPAPVVEKLNAELIRIAKLPSVREKMASQGIDLMPAEPPAAVDKLVRDELALWVPIIKASGATAE